MKHVTIHDSSINDMIVPAEGGLVLHTKEGGAPVAVILTVEDYRALRGVAALASEPNRFMQALDENRRFQNGETETKEVANSFDEVLELVSAARMAI